MFFIDESGIIPSDPSNRKIKHRYFVISLVHTDDPQKLKRAYRHAVGNLKNKFPTFFAQLEDPNEMKGSEALPYMKYYILEKLIKSTDIRIGHMIVDTWNIPPSFRENKARTFNYLIKLVMENFPLSADDKLHLKLKIDNRNSAVQSLKSLEDYLCQELVLGKHMVNQVSVEYLDSKNIINVQVADLIANTLFQIYRNNGISFPSYTTIDQTSTLSHPDTYHHLYNLIKPALVLPFVFPPPASSTQVQVAATVAP